MRSTTADVKMLSYDEPSAALDPKAECGACLNALFFHFPASKPALLIAELFERLRNLRDGKTMLFITQ